jgi:tRNA-dihydrouridine synthase B
MPIATPLRIGKHVLRNNVVLAPMAGVTDLPMRELCLELGVGLTVGEMVTADPSLVDSRKSIQRRRASTLEKPRSIQLVGREPGVLAEAARRHVDEGADIIDINMGCPAKKVCRKAAGSALLADEPLVGQILEAVVNAVPVPVTLKIRTGVDPESRNAVTIARIAEEAGIQLLSVHGRTRADRFKGEAEYDTIAAVVQHTRLPVLANGDITSAEKARQILAYTGAAGVMIGRAAQGRLWLPGLIADQLAGLERHAPSQQEQLQLLHRHVVMLHEFYEEFLGTRIARKHVGWCLESLLPSHAGQAREHHWTTMTTQLTQWKQEFNRLSEPRTQLRYLEEIESLMEQFMTDGPVGELAA